MSRTTQPKKRFCLSPSVRRWLVADDPEDCEVSSQEHYDRWVAPRERGEKIIQLGSVLVDEVVLHTRFDCVADRCKPGAKSKSTRPGTRKVGRKWCSCCVDVFVPVTVAERRRLGRMRSELAEYLHKREPRLRPEIGNGNGRVPAFWLDEDGDALSQPDDRCVFSEMDSKGRIRCHLYPFARKNKLAQEEIQPFTCRIFPLLVIQMERGVLLTVLNKENYRAWETFPPWRFPCMADPKLPPLVKSMASTLDWMFGEGFAKTLQSYAKV